ncbi:putative HAD family phosphatase [Paratrimastix pyriformis]|uniref:HAD family phosphatase n=1 Tax=Paratrimastix pyriformis TaxID=342808 RepID=A0ABQ8UVP1_9EUKA|nr:putative HAD family phosphatase [Paratrimastix pyriformis]
MQIAFPNDMTVYDAIIFDCDGTLVDSMPIHFKAFSKAFRAHGLIEPLNEHLFYTLGGVPTRRVAQILADHHHIAIDPEAIFHEKEQNYLEILPEVTEIVPVADFARRVSKTHHVAVASGGPRDVVQRTLQYAGLDRVFSTVISADDVPQGRGKPAPDMFLLAAKRLGAEPGRCLVFEDAQAGIEAARAAGMAYVYVPSQSLHISPSPSPALASPAN